MGFAQDIERLEKSIPKLRGQDLGENLRVLLRLYYRDRRKIQDRDLPEDTLKVIRKLFAQVCDKVYDPTDYESLRFILQEGDSLLGDNLRLSWPLLLKIPRLHFKRLRWGSTAARIAKYFRTGSMVTERKISGLLPEVQVRENTYVYSRDRKLYTYPGNPEYVINVEALLQEAALFYKKVYVLEGDKLVLSYSCNDPRDRILGLVSLQESGAFEDAYVNTTYAGSRWPLSSISLEARDFVRKEGPFLIRQVKEVKSYPEDGGSTPKGICQFILDMAGK